MRTYATYAPTGFDPAGSFLPEQQNWLVVPCGRNRDSDCLEESNFASALETLGGESEDCEVHRFGHWACGWFEIIIVRPGSAAELIAMDIEDKLDNYPILDEPDFSDRETTKANRVWSSCYSWRERIEYMRDHPGQFEPGDFSDLMACARGNYFIGYASELLR